jgi:CBS domain-containing protein
METIGDILGEKGGEVYTVSPDATVFEAVQTMCERHVGALLVATPERTTGILSERDVMTRVILARRDPDRTRVDEVMTHYVVCVRVTTSVREAMAVMTERRCRHLPVVGDGRIVGILSIGDLVRSASREQAFEIRMLQDYIHGAYG